MYASGTTSRYDSSWLSANPAPAYPTTSTPLETPLESFGAATTPPQVDLAPLQHVPPPPNTPQAFNIEHAGPPPIFYADGGFDAQATAMVGQQMGRVHMTTSLASRSSEINLSWHMNEPPPLYNPALAQHGMNAAQYDEITGGIRSLFKRNQDKLCLDLLLTFATGGIYLFCCMIPRDEKDTADMIAHLKQLNVTWNPHRITFNREFIPYMGTFCTIKTFS